jgi:hypothetical protein
MEVTGGITADAQVGRQWLKSAGNDSWHIVDPESVASLMVVSTLCGLTPRNYDLRGNRPGNEASCENCLRIEVGD